MPCDKNKLFFGQGACSVFLGHWEFDMYEVCQVGLYYEVQPWGLWRISLHSRITCRFQLCGDHDESWWPESETCSFLLIYDQTWWLAKALQPLSCQMLIICCALRVLPICTSGCSQMQMPYFTILQLHNTHTMQRDHCHVAPVYMLLCRSWLQNNDSEAMRVHTVMWYDFTELNRLVDWLVHAKYLFFCKEACFVSCRVLQGLGFKTTFSSRASRI